MGNRARVAAIAPVLLGLALALALVTIAAPGTAGADVIDDEASQLARAPTYKRRLAAVLALSRSHDGRAVTALARALGQDREPQIRRGSALALAKALDDTTPRAARELAFTALDRAATGDRDRNVRDLATRALQKLDGLRPVRPNARLPALFVHVGVARDPSRQASADTLSRLTTTVRKAVGRGAPKVATTWPGQLPNARQLTRAGTRAFVVTATVSALKITRAGGKAEIACSVQVRIAPWSGTDGVEKWVAHKAAAATGSGKAITGGSASLVAGGIRDCVLAVGDEVTARQVVPFLKRVIADG